jgi:hypothetical protein
MEFCRYGDKSRWGNGKYKLHILDAFLVDGLAIIMVFIYGFANSQ